MKPSLVIGDSGNTGSRVVERLVSMGAETVAAARSEIVTPGAGYTHFDWYDPGTHETALEGVDKLYLVPPIGESDPAPIMVPFLDHAIARGAENRTTDAVETITGRPPRTLRNHVLSEMSVSDLTRHE